MEEKVHKRVLVCPLGWGLGHASRDIPIIDSLQKNGNEVIVAGDKLQLALLSQRFYGISTILFPSFKVRFSKTRNQTLPLLWIALRLPYHILKEHFILKRLIKRLKIDIVISDNRFGLWNNDIKTILITHQLKVIFPKLFRVFEPVGAWVIRLMAEKFDSCWIPDYPDSNGLAGELSHLKKLPSNARYIGILSRFQKMESSPISTSWELVGIVSGPSPQREIFIDKMEKLSQKHNIKTLIVKGIPSEGVDIVEKDGIWYAGHLNDMEFAEVIKSSKYLICRAGYSSIMDMASLGIKCILVPTPGQTEQEYLAKHLSNNGLFNTYKQIELENINISSSQTIQNSPTNSSELLEKIIVEVACSV